MDETDWSGLFGILMCHGAMSRQEILNSPLPFLHAVSAAIVDSAALFSLSPFTGMSGAVSDPVETSAAAGTEVSSETIAMEINNMFGSL